MSSETLGRFEVNSDDFIELFLTIDESCIHHFQPETKFQSKQWKRHDSFAPKKAKTMRSAGKFTTSVFWDSKGLVFVNFLPKGQTINGEYYANLLRQLREEIKAKRPGKLTKAVFHQESRVGCRNE